MDPCAEASRCPEANTGGGNGTRGAVLGATGGAIEGAYQGYAQSGTTSGAIGGMLQGAAVRYGHGRVAAFTDITIQSDERTR